MRKHRKGAFLPLKKTVLIGALVFLVALSGISAQASGIELPIDGFTSNVTARVTAAALPDQVTGADGYDWAHAAAYQVSAVKDGKPVTPTKDLNVSLTVPDGANASRCAVFLLSGDTAAICVSTLSGSARKISTKTMGLYAVAELLPAAVKGDLNGDSSVTDVDRVLLSRYLAGWDVPEPGLDTADINEDGSITAIDRAILARYLAGWGAPYDAWFQN